MYKTLVAVVMFFVIFSPGNGRSNDDLSTIDKEYISFYSKIVETILPQYRLPQESDYKSYWKYKESYVYKTRDNENKQKAPYWTKGFFNEDKIIDYAYILINRRNGKKSLYAILSVENEYKPILLEDKIDEEMGVATQQKGRVLTASGKGFWKPTKNEPPGVYVKSNAIAFFAFEGTSSLFIWNEEVSKFKRHWISD